MREKSDRSKIEEQRGKITDEFYLAWKKATEARSWGKASVLYDPVVGRAVHTLSSAETKVFWMLRYMPEVREIYEQFPLSKKEVTATCHSLGIRAYSSILTTDFLVRLKNDSLIAVCVKDSRNVYDPEKNPRYEKDIQRLTVEKIYWQKNYDIPLRAIFGNEINDVAVNNIRNVMHFYECRHVTNRISKLKYLIAHHIITIPMDIDYLRFGDLAEELDVEGIYETHINSAVKNAGSE